MIEYSVEERALYRRGDIGEGAAVLAVSVLTGLGSRRAVRSSRERTAPPCERPLPKVRDPERLLPLSRISGEGVLICAGK